MKIAFIGLGTMGGPMAMNICKAFDDVRVYDISKPALASFSSLNCSIARSPADAAQGADVAMLMLPDSPQVRDAIFGRDGVASTLKPGGFVVDLSTISAAESIAIGNEATGAGFRFVDAPIGRTPRDALAGTLLVIAGGEESHICELTPIFNAIASEIVHAGPRGSGIKLKLVNNYMSTVGAVLTAEALCLARKAGLDRNIAVRVLRSTTAGRGQLLVNFPTKVLAGDTTPDFPMRMAHKDISHALTLGAMSGSPLMLGAVARELFGLASPWKRDREDWTAVLLLLEDISRAEQMQSGDEK
jgi:4-hydroxybutyrate dehydrogenase/sulfolactaldehyde 3-reductase